MKFFRNFYILCFICANLTFANKNTNVSGDISFYYMNRLSDNSLVNVPFRMLNLDVLHQNNNFDVIGKMALEYRNRKDIDFMESSNPVDINTVLRELYLTYYLENGEISLGKKIYNWGSVDENSPIDILNAYDNYYLLLGPNERKLGSYSMSIDYYINNGTTKLTGLYAPMHNATRYPINDNEYEFGLPASIDSRQIMPLKNPAEMGIAIQQTFNRGDITLSHYKAYDRVPSLSGFNRYQKIVLNDDTWVYDPSELNEHIDIVLSYNLTEATNLGSVLLFDDFTIRFDFSNFKSIDENNIDDFYNRDCSSIGYGALGATCTASYYDESVEKFIIGSSDAASPDANNEDYNNIDQEKLQFITGEKFAYPIEEKLEYTQKTFQFELPLTNNFQINMQYFKYDFNKNKYSFNEVLEDNIYLDITNLVLPEYCNPNNVESCLLPYGVYTPGIGAPFAMISSETLFISLEKTILEDDLKITISSLMDLDKGFGELISVEADYNLGNGLETIIGLTKIIGDNEEENYIFNELENFSNIRFELKYNF